MPHKLHYPHIVRFVAGREWAILPEKMAEIWDFLAIKASGGDVDPDEITARFGAAKADRRGQSAGEVAVLPIMGTISHRMNMMSEFSGGTSVEGLTAAFRDLVRDPQVGAIVLDVDSPGGSVDGIDELAAEIYRARGSKPIVAVANSLMASAAYWLAVSADEIVASPSAEIGSIGVIGGHEDQSAFYDKMGVKVSLITAGKYKAENNPFEPMTEEGRAAIQRRVDEAYGRFVRAVSRGRGVGVDAVRNGFGEGRVVSAREAVSLGMADRIATIDEVIAGLARSTRQASRESASADATAGLVAVPYEAHGQRVAADLAAFAEATRDRIEYRQAEPGRALLSAVQRDRLASLRDELTDLLTAVDGAGSPVVIPEAELLSMQLRMRVADVVLADAS